MFDLSEAQHTAASRPHSARVAEPTYETCITQEAMAPKGAYFNRITERSACAVRFQHVVARGVVSHRLDETSLRSPVRRGEARARSVLSHGGATHGDVAGCHLEVKCCTPFAATVPVCAAIKGVAPAERGEHAGSCKSF